jgi:ribosomal protein L29
MAKIAAKVLREKTDPELLEHLRMERKRIFDETVRGASGEAIKPHEKRSGRRLMARIQTILRQRALRRELDSRIKMLQDKSQGASPRAARLAQAPVNAQRPRRKVRPEQAATAADRAAFELAEVKRRRAALEHPDQGDIR